MAEFSIKRVAGREILDSRGNPTLEAAVLLENGTAARASVPCGASTGSGEAASLRDGGARYNGRGMLKSVKAVNTSIHEGLLGMNACDTAQIDAKLLSLDGTKDKSHLGGGAMLAVSLACARAAAAGLKLPLFRFIGGVSANTMPVPQVNVMGGGLHSDNPMDVQEFLILPVGAPSFREGLRWSAEVYQALGEVLRKNGQPTAVSDEGGYAPQMKNERDALDMIMEAIAQAGYRPYTDFVLGMDAAASSWRTDDGYLMPKSQRFFSSQELIDYWAGLAQAYPLYSLEDPLAEDDWDGWQKLTCRLGGSVQLVGDDLFTTSAARLAQGIKQGCGNAVIIKPNQIGTLSEALETVRLARRSGFATVISHRSGETQDSFIADLAVAINAGQIKAGAPCRGERIAKYNQLLRIEEAIGRGRTYPGMSCFSPRMGQLSAQ